MYMYLQLYSSINFYSSHSSYIQTEAAAVTRSLLYLEVKLVLYLCHGQYMHVSHF